MAYLDYDGNEIEQDQFYYIIGEEVEAYNYNEIMEKLNNDNTLQFINTNSSDYFICTDCNYVYTYDTTHFYTHNNNIICESCYIDNGYTWCGDCDGLYHESDMTYNEEEDAYFCESCNSSRHSQKIYSYHHHKGKEKFKKTNYDTTDLYFGIELEVENANYHDNESIASYIYNNLNNDVYFESDGSLRNGFEIITHPFTFNYWRDVLTNKYKNMCDYLIDKGYKSNDTSTCGLHVHISRKALGNTPEEINDNVNKIILFTEYYKDNIIKFARRGSTHYMQFLSDYLYDNNMLKDKLEAQSIYTINNEKDDTRYFAINNTNDNTLEFRIFKGTLKHSTIYATIEFINNLVQCVKEYPLNKISFSKVINANKTTYLKEYLKDRDIKYDCKYLVDSTNKLKKLHNKRLKYIKLLNTNLDIVINDLELFYNNKLKENLKNNDFKNKNTIIYNLSYNVRAVMQYLESFKANYKRITKEAFINSSNIDTLLNLIKDINYYLDSINYTSNKLDILKKNITALKEVK